MTEEEWAGERCFVHWLFLLTHKLGKQLRRTSPRNLVESTTSSPRRTQYQNRALQLGRQMAERGPNSKVDSARHDRELVCVPVAIEVSLYMSERMNVSGYL
jgi:hypothetical protein